MSFAPDTLTPPENFDESAWHQQLQTQYAQSRQAEAEASAKIVVLAQETDATRLFVAVFARLSIAPTEQICDETHCTAPAKLGLLAFLTAAYWQTPKGETSEGKISETVTGPNSEQIQRCLDLLEIAFNARIGSRGLQGVLEQPPGQPHDDALWRAMMVRNRTEIVHGSAYQEQTAQEIREIQGRFDPWFAQRMGISSGRPLGHLRRSQSDDPRTNAIS